MKSLSSIILVLFVCAGCRQAPSPDPDKDVFLVPLKGRYVNDSAILQDTASRVYFTKGFWQYFRRSHPRAAAAIFLNHLDSINYTVIERDSSLALYVPNTVAKWFYTALLADSVGGVEKEGGPFGGCFFTVPSDSGEVVADTLPKTHYRLTKVEQAEFVRLKSILTNADSIHAYVIVYKKRIGRQLFDTAAAR